MNVVRVPFPWEGNDLYPLVPDFLTLDSEGQRLARVNTCRQWLLPPEAFPVEGVSDPTLEQRQIARALHCVWSLDFFDRYYLWPDVEAGYDPGFYDDAPLETPQFHRDMIGATYLHRMTLAVFPRGSAKSTTMRKDCLLRNLTRPRYSLVYATSSSDNATDTGQILKSGYYENERVFNDFAPLPEFGGRIRPNRGEASTGVEKLFLANGSWIQMRSVGGRQRGMRPRRYRLDDPEYDEKKSTSMEDIRDGMKTLLFKIVLPMVFREGCGVDWTATFVSQRHYAYHAMQVEQSPEGPRAKDARFNYWARLMVKALSKGPDGKVVSCWPEMWPATTADRLERAKADPKYQSRVSLEEIREQIGSPNFNSEMQGEPGDAGEGYFPLITREKHGYWFENPDANLGTNPSISHTFICWKRRDAEVRMELAEFLRLCKLFICCDWADTHTSDSDYKTACLMGYLPTSNELFVLDLWMDQKPKEKQVAAIFTMAETWRCPSVHPEVVKGGVALYDDLLDKVRTRAMDVTGNTWVFSVKGIKPGNTSKQEKIASLHIRFEHGTIKMPLWRRDRHPWSMLIEQFEGFNPSAPNGGLSKDDGADTVAMSQFVLKGRLYERGSSEKPANAVDRILSGDTLLDGGVPIGLGVDWSRVPMEQIREILQMNTPGNSDDERSKV